MQPHSEIIQRDDGFWSLGWCDDAPGPFPSRQFAEAVSAVRADAHATPQIREVQNARTS
jgi:hypothetical protein